MVIRWRILIDCFWRDAKSFWIFFGGVVLSTMVAWLTTSTVDAALKVASTVLQLLGLLLVAYGLRDLREMFGRPTIISQIRDRFKKLLSAFRKPEPIILHVEPGSATTSVGNPIVRITPAPHVPITERISLLEKDVATLWDFAKRIQSNSLESLDALSHRTREQLSSLQKTNQDLTRKLEEIAVGGLHLELVGLGWLFFGILFGTIPDELTPFVTNVLRLFAPV